ncbi:restriction endonuclease subunit S [Helicobacter pylori]|uniref:restriction endonuclease subunit S n=1 Tax=Helicobacter pylori TaxID=210 RepID=UPI0025760FDB|nr:restriction endonuclease subunit S [Helicobacter pylori]WJI93593.1 restriction endonuclease subunit S [Helicobacter pylori]
MIGPLSSQLNAIKWGEFKLGDLFEIEKTLSFNKDALTQGQDYDYITRTSQNQGVLQTTGFVNAENLNPPFTWSLGLLQMDFFYRKKSWYAGQFMRKITPKTEIENKINSRIAHYFTTLLNALKRPLLSVLVRDIDKTFREQKIQLPLKPTANTQTIKDIDFPFMEKFIAELEQCRLAELEAYLKAAGLSNTTLSNEEENALNVFNNNNSGGGGGGNTPCGLTWQSFRLGDLFEKLDLKFKKKIFNKQKDISKVQTSEFDLPLVNAKNGDNGIMYYGRSSDFESAEMTIDIVNDGAVSTANVYPQPLKTGVLYNAYLIKPKFTPTRETLLFFTPCIYKAIKLKFSYENKASWNKVKNELISLPLKPTANTQTLDDIDFDFMRTLINALMKQTIQGVAQYCGAKIQATKEIISQETPVQKDSLF